MTNKSEPAFHYKYDKPEYGLSKREYMATEILNGILSCYRDLKECDGKVSRCKTAVEYADALIEELNK